MGYFVVLLYTIIQLPEKGGFMQPYLFFGEFFKTKRQENTKLTLRAFCLKHGLDPGNMSRLERGITPPPSRNKLKQFASYLKIKKGSDDWYELFDRAVACKGKIPPEVLSNKKLVEKLPLVFRTLRGQRVPEEQLDELIKLIKKT